MLVGLGGLETGALRLVDKDKEMISVGVLGAISDLDGKQRERSSNDRES
jgi:hypothetical protein